MSTTPSPTLLARKKVAVPAPPPQPQPALVVKIDNDPGHIVRPGLVDEVVTTIHTGVVKTKHLRRGQRVRPFVHGEPRGGERIVEKVRRLEDGAEVEVTWASGHGVTTHKAAYRWHDASLVGTEVQHVVKAPGFVAYEES